MGTIIRYAIGFGMPALIVRSHPVDCYNQVLQATMGFYKPGKFCI